MIDPQDFRVIMGFLEAAFPRWQPHPATHEVYYQTLGDLPTDQLKAAVQSYIAQDTPWPPSAGQLRNAAFDLIETVENKLDANLAWGEVVKKLGADGHIRIPQFSDPTIDASVEAIGGWRYICFSPESAMVSNRARFVTAYEVLVKRTRDNERMLPQVRDIVKRLAVEKRMQLGDGKRETKAI